MLDKDTFLRTVAAAPLVSIDLIVVRDNCEALLGRRNNRPAQGYWFVPGGRIFKDERRCDTLYRLADKELGLGQAIDTGKLVPKFQGIYEHFYSDCFAGDIGISTHYVVLGFRIDVPRDFALPHHDDQHAELRWWPISDLKASDAVHRFTKDYFSEVTP